MLTASPQIHTPADEPVDQSVLGGEAQSVGHMFRDRIAASPDRPAYLHAVVKESGDEWVTVTWAELDVVVREIGAGLIALGIEPEDRVAIASSTRYEWALADLAVMVAGGATTTIYPTTMADDVAFIVSDSGAKVVFAENAEQLEKLRGIRAETPAVLRVIVFDGVSDADSWTLTLDEVRQLGREYLEGDPGAIDARIDGIQHDQLATIIYTSGTTGRPKGVRLRHSAWTYEGAAVASTNILSGDDLQYLWLPLAHVFGKVLLTLPLQIGFPTAIDGRIDKIVDNLAVVKPTFMGAVPRIFEKAYGRISTMMADEGGLKRAIFRWAIDVGRRFCASAARRAATVRGAQPAAIHRRQAGLRQAAPALRWTAAVLHLRLGAAVTGDQRVLSTPPASSCARATGSPSRAPPASSTCRRSSGWARWVSRCRAPR